METQNYCSCKNQDVGLTLCNSPYCRNCDEWINMSDEELKKIISTFN